MKEYKMDFEQINNAFKAFMEKKAEEDRLKKIERRDEIIDLLLT